MHTNRDARTFRKILKTIKHRINTATGLPIQRHFDRQMCRLLCDQVPTKSISGPARSPKNPEKTQTDDDGEAGEDAEMKMGFSTHTKTRETLEIAQGVRV